jgi:hypothetical protein
MITIIIGIDEKLFFKIAISNKYFKNVSIPDTKFSLGGGGGY